MPLYLGGNEPDAIYLGSSAVDKVYLGATQVWPSEAPSALERFGSATGVNSITFPVGYQADDVALVVCSSESGSVSTPSGWTQAAAANIRAYFWKRLTGSEGASVSFAGANKAHMVVYRGADDPVFGSEYNVRVNDSETTGPYVLGALSGKPAGAFAVRLVAAASNFGGVPAFSTGGIATVTAVSAGFTSAGIGEQVVDGSGNVAASQVSVQNGWLGMIDAIVPAA
jgi:hypothetical protein